jgi:hypothetical protein
LASGSDQELNLLGSATVIAEGGREATFGNGKT